jgi:hypothetical protein
MKMKDFLVVMIFALTTAMLPHRRAGSGFRIADDSPTTYAFRFVETCLKVVTRVRL